MIRLAPAADFVLPFDLPKAGVRGRFVRLADASSRALSVTPLPEAAGRLAGEMLALASLMGSLLKLDGRLTTQTKSDGPVGFIVADSYGAESVGEGAPRGVRGLARVDAEALARLGRQPTFAALVGQGALAITIRPRAEDRDYQGIVALSPEGLAASAETYFSQSEQLATRVRLAAAPMFLKGQAEPQWRAGGLLLQEVPDAEHGPDDWDRAAMLAATVEDVELLDADLPAETLLWRLFHQEEVRVLPPAPVAFRCPCDKANIAQVLARYAPEERAKLADADGIIRARCEFCGTVHELSRP